ncbi:Fic/DOC family protein [Leucobacter sp. HY1910]
MLRNKPGADTAEALAAIEVDLTVSRTIQLQTYNLVPGTRDLAELQALHQHIFQDLFDWAGRLRTIDMRRGQGQFFAPQAGLETNAFHVFTSLKDKKFLQGLGRASFVDELAVFYDQLNYIHPFREGNGRTQRLFWSRVAHDAGWVLDWRPIHGEELNEVSRAAREEGKLAALRDALAQCVAPT